MNKLFLKRKRIRRAAKAIKRDGVLSTSIRALQKVEKKYQRKSKHKKLTISYLAKYQDVLNANWSTHPYVYIPQATKPPFTVNWVISPPGKGEGGGHQNIFRFIAYLVNKGHKCNIYLYSGKHFQDAKEAHNVFKESYPGVEVTFQWLKGPMKEADAVFATGWETAYPVFCDLGSARKFYFVQDFEPYFYPVGSEYILAENTYRFNFYGITAGGWLAHKLNNEYGMDTDNYDFGADTDLYRFENTNERKEVFFYARPVTTRRGFELGIMALEIFHKQKPQYTITLAGWDVSEYKISFPYKNLKTMELAELSDVYNQCAAALVISLTNMSLMPLELLAAGTIPIVTDGPNNKEVSSNPFIKFAHASPDALAKALIETVERADLPSYAEKGAKSVAKLDWSESCKRLEGILRRELHG